MMLASSSSYWADLQAATEAVSAGQQRGSDQRQEAVSSTRGSGGTAGSKLDGASVAGWAGMVHTARL
jgi:hypothetical protein